MRLLFSQCRANFLTGNNAIRATIKAASRAARKTARKPQNALIAWLPGVFSALLMVVIFCPVAVSAQNASPSSSALPSTLPSALSSATPSASASAKASTAPDANYDPTKPSPKQAAEIVKVGDQKAFIWEVKSDTNTVFLFGTIHVGKKSFYPLPATVENALRRSAKLVLEADISNTADGAEISKLLTYTPPDSIEKHISAALYERVKQQAIRLRWQPNGFSNMKPFIVVGALSINEYMRLGYDMTEGVETYLIKRAKEENKPVLELESQLGQMSIFSNMPAALQEAMLDNALATIEAGKTSDQITGVVNAWQSGDVKLMQDVTSDVTKDARQTEALDEILLYGRNAAMLKKIQGYLAEDKNHFIAVGALHLIGPRGLVELLKSKGYRVRQL